MTKPSDSIDMPQQLVDEERELQEAEADTEAEKHRMAELVRSRQYNPCELAAFDNLDEEQDAQIIALEKLLSAATNFASLKLTKKYLEIPKMMKLLDELFAQMYTEANQLGKMNAAVQELFQCFVETVNRIKSQIKRILTVLRDSELELDVLDTIFKMETAPGATEVEKVVANLFDATKRLHKWTKEVNHEAREVHERILKFRLTVSEKKAAVEMRRFLRPANFVKAGASATVGGTTAGLAVGGIVASEFCGGSGALVVTYTTGALVINPVGAIVAAIFAGITGVGGLAALIIWLLNHQNRKALDILQRILEQLAILNHESENFARGLDDFDAEAEELEQTVKRLQECLQSEIRRKQLSNVCTRLKTAVENIKECMETIINHDTPKLPSNVQTTAIDFKQ